MNSVLQCLSNTKPLLLFCLQDDLEKYLNKSSTSCMKGVLMQGQNTTREIGLDLSASVIIAEYAALLRKMWLSQESRAIVSPLSFKNTIGNFAPRFTGYSYVTCAFDIVTESDLSLCREQDSQEFLRYLLQGLHEDVNRVQQQPSPVIVDEREEERLRYVLLLRASNPLSTETQFIIAFEYISSTRKNLRGRVSHPFLCKRTPHSSRYDHRIVRNKCAHATYILRCPRRRSKPPFFSSSEDDRAAASWNRCLRYENSPLVGKF